MLITASAAVIDAGVRSDALAAAASLKPALVRVTVLEAADVSAFIPKARIYSAADSLTATSLPYLSTTILPAVAELTVAP